MKEFTVGKNESGQRLDKLLAKILSQAPKSFIYKMLRKKNIVLNDKKASGDEKTAVGDQIKIYLSDDTFEKFAGAVKHVAASQNGATQESKDGPNDAKTKAVLDQQIVYEDEDLLVINKPSGILSQKAKPTDYSVNEWVIDHLMENGTLDETSLQTFRPSICNRLDRNTSGLLIAGKTLQGLQQMAACLKDRSMQKFYRCIVKGQMKDMHLKGYLVKNHSTNQVKIFQTPQKDGEAIETSWKVVAQWPDAALLEVHLITGKSHQIRAHLASTGHPILGDTKYGDRNWNDRMKKACSVRAQLLHAYRMEFPDGKVLSAPVPSEFERAEKYLNRRS